ncbi:MAG: tail fiber domain-containing protein [Flavobacteriaceae bacterium]|nr:tail fiber domain-containing protein [Flavobacteriaceae bacterium]
MYEIITRIALTSLLLASINNYAQVGIGTTTVDPSAELEIYSTDKGVLAPRMTQVQRITIGTPAEGLLVYQTDNTIGFWYFDGTVWTTFGGGTGWSITGDAGTTPGTNFLGTTDATDLVVKTSNIEAFRIDAIGNVGIGTTTPTAKVDIVGTSPIFRYVDGLEASNYVLMSDANGNAFWQDDSALVITADDDWLWTTGSSNSDPIYHIGQTVIGKNTIATPSTVELDIDNGSASGTQIGIGTTYFEDGLSVTYLSNTMTPNDSPSTYNLGFNNTTTGGIHRFNNVYGFAATINTSDGSLKKDIKNLGYGIKEIMKMNPISYTWKEEINGKYDKSTPKELKLGFSAQELEKIIPEAVVSEMNMRTDESGSFTKMKTEYMGVRYEYLIPVLVNAQKEQQIEIENLLAKNKTLKEKLNNINK